jgi:poly-gamma-glutamate synthesis protein (capsule biosynthesis protein)
MRTTIGEDIEGRMTSGARRAPRSARPPLTRRLVGPGALVVLVAIAAACAGTTNSASAPPGTDAAGHEIPAGPDGAPAETAPPTTAAPRHFTLAASGDILIHAPIMREAKAVGGGKSYVFDQMFDKVRPLISGADFAICHQETPISSDDTNLSVPNTLSFNAPTEIAGALKRAGFDACDTASNHTWDRGLTGVKSTISVLEAAGLQHSGSSISQAAADDPPIYDIKGVKVGHLAYSYDIYNTAMPDTKVPPEAPWLKSMLWPALGAAGMIAQAHALKARGAEFVVMSIHWGDEYVHQPTAQQRQLAKDLLASPDVDLILGDHVHVVQPCEKIGDKYVEYGMGNFLSNQSPTQDRTLVSDNQDGSLETYTVDEVAPEQFKVTKMQYTPTWVVIPGHTIEAATPTAHADSYARTVKAIGMLGPGACDATPTA